MLSSTTEMQTGYVLESLASEVDTISLPMRQTYGHDHKSQPENQQKLLKLSQSYLTTNNCHLFVVKFTGMSIYTYSS